MESEDEVHKNEFSGMSIKDLYKPDEPPEAMFKKLNEWNNKKSCEEYIDVLDDSYFNFHDEPLQAEGTVGKICKGSYK
jgi:hypothetical protein